MRGADVRHGSQAGIAIVSVLMVLMALTIFGLSSLFLTQMNLGIASNARATTMADNNAATGLNAAFVALQAYYETNGELPTSLSLPTLVGRNYSPTYTLADYVRFSPTSAYVSVIGTASGQGEYVSEAVVQVESQTTLPSYFGYGIATEGTFKSSNNANFVNSGIHANKGFTFENNQTYSICAERYANGKCKTPVEVTQGVLPITASPGATTCSVKNNASQSLKDICVGSPAAPRYLTDPVAIVPDFDERMADALAAVSKGALYSNLLGIYCDVKYASMPAGNTLRDTITAQPAGATVCVESGAVSFSNFHFGGINLVTSGNITLSNNWSATDVVLISTNGTITTQNNYSMENARLFAEKDISLKNNSDLKGQTTIASGANISISGNSDTIAGSNGSPAIGLALIAENNITIENNSTFFLAAVAGGTLTITNNSDVWGSLAAKGNITVSGNFDIDAGLAIENPDLGSESQPVLRALSRR